MSDTLAKLQAALAAQREGPPSDEWRTAQEWEDLWGKGRFATRSILRNAKNAKPPLAEVAMFYPRNGDCRKQPHYALRLT